MAQLLETTSLVKYLFHHPFVHPPVKVVGTDDDNATISPKEKKILKEEKEKRERERPFFQEKWPRLLWNPEADWKTDGLQRSFIITCPYGRLGQVVVFIEEQIEKIQGQLDKTEDRVKKIREKLKTQKGEQYKTARKNDRLKMKEELESLGLLEPELRAWEDQLERCQVFENLGEPFPYERLPFEVRNMILKELLSSLFEETITPEDYTFGTGEHFYEIHARPILWSYKGRLVSSYQGWSVSSTLLVSKQMRQEAGDVFFNYGLVDFSAAFRKILQGGGIQRFDPTFLRAIRRISLVWTHGENTDNDVKVAQAISSLKNLKELHLSIDWVHFRHKHTPRLDVGHWLAHTPGIQELLLKCHPLQAVAVFHGKTDKEHSMWEVTEFDREYTREYLQNFLNERLVPASQQAKEWPENRAKMLDALMRNAVSIGTNEDKDDVRRSLQTLGYPKKLVDGTVRETSYDCRRALEIMDHKMEEI